MREEYNIVIDWADDYGLELQEQSYEKDSMAWKIVGGNPRLVGINDLKERLWDIEWELNFDEHAFAFTIYDYYLDGLIR